MTHQCHEALIRAQKKSGRGNQACPPMGQSIRKKQRAQCEGGLSAPLVLVELLLLIGEWISSVSLQ